uniref:Uncharacterized protein n=1 Tax=candidate division WOR-3 bacterium TaxID=2052148 RepID=A0A7C6A8H1_UNCW3
MEIIKKKAVEEKDGYEIIEYFISINHTPAEKRFIDDAIPKFPEIITKLIKPNIQTRDNNVQIKFAFSTKDLNFEQAKSAVDNWCQTLTETIQAQANFLPLYEENLNLKAMLRSIQVRLDDLETFKIALLTALPGSIRKRIKI